MDRIMIKRKSILQNLKRFANSIETINFRNENEVFGLIQKCEQLQDKISQYQESISFDVINPYTTMDNFHNCILKIYANLQKEKKDFNKLLIKQLRIDKRECLQNVATELSQINANDSSKNQRKRLKQKELLRDLDRFICNLDNQEPSEMESILEECISLEKRINRMNQGNLSKELSYVINIKHNLSVIIEDMDVLSAIKTYRNTNRKEDLKPLMTKLKREKCSSIKVSDIKKEMQLCADKIENVYKKYLRRKKLHVFIVNLWKKIKNNGFDYKEDYQEKMENKFVAKSITKPEAKKAEKLDSIVENVRISTKTELPKHQYQYTPKKNTLMSMSSSMIGRSIKIYDESMMHNNIELVKENNNSKVIATVVSNGIDVQVVTDNRQLMNYMQRNYRIIRYGVPAIVYYDVENTKPVVKELKIPC